MLRKRVLLLCFSHQKSGDASTHSFPINAEHYTAVRVSPTHTYTHTPLPLLSMLLVLPLQGLGACTVRCGSLSA